MSGEKAYQQIVDHRRPRKTGRLVPFGSSEFAERANELTLTTRQHAHAMRVAAACVYVCACLRACLRACAYAQSVCARSRKRVRSDVLCAVTGPRRTHAVCIWKRAEIGEGSETSVLASGVFPGQ